MSRINYYQTVPHAQQKNERSFEVGMQLEPDSIAGENISEEPSSFQFPSELQQSRGYFLKFCAFISAVTAFTLAATILLQCFCIIVSTSMKESRNFYELIYRLYGLSFASIGFFCEMEWTETVRTTSLLQFWITRGHFYIFIALLTIQEYGDLIYGAKRLEAVVLTLGISLIVLGIIYTIMV
jgi:hypothetical protein